MSHDRYENPLISRYASREMAELWSEQRKFTTWRKIWLWLAEAEQELGLAISNEQLAEMRTHLSDIDFAAAQAYERRFRHDVMAHVHAFGDVCPAARPIIHLGATSCSITDNSDLLQLRDALHMVSQRLAAVIDHLGTFAARYRDLPCLAFTHLQPAQPTTVGKRATLWAHDLALDLEEVEHRLSSLKALSMKGTTGTQASFLALFQGDHAKVRELELRVARKMGFDGVYPVSGQTYTRKVDSAILDTLSGIAQSAHKMATDLRLLASRKEVEEPHETEQIGSSAMAYKRNPMRSERICALARFAMSLPGNAAQTVATQWMERTLDDSANRRLVIPQAFLTIDAVLLLYQNIAAGFVVYPEIVRKNLMEELPFMATENILMEAVQGGGDRQHLHEQIRQHSWAAVDAVKAGQPNDLVARLKADSAFRGIEIDRMLAGGNFVGRAPEQVDEFLREVVEPIRERYRSAGHLSAEVKV
jgi:adenylosuccinate lyase